MRQLLFIAALLGGTSPAAATTADTNLEKALLIEWMVAHCDQSKIPMANVAVSQMVINGSDEAAVNAKRAFIKQGVKSRYSGPDDACTQLIAGFK